MTKFIIGQTLTASRRGALAGIASLAATAANASPTKQGRQFPDGFLWGAATAGHQVEGNNTNSDIWFLEHLPTTTYTEPSGDAANSFELWATDLDLVKSLNLNTYRFSLEWARIEPEPGQFSQAMLDHYKAMIDGCRERDIAPFVTFNHFSAPRWFAARAGWHHMDAAQVFARYCDRAARHLAGGISHATTLNEPNLPELLASILPAQVVDQDRAMLQVAARTLGVDRFSAANSVFVDDPNTYRAHMIAGHVQGRSAIKAARSDLPVGVSISMIDEQGERRLRDAKREQFYGDWLRAARSDDFIGVQNYERRVWTARGPAPASSDAPRNAMGAEIYAPSLAGAVRYAHAATGLPVIVTEHGLGTDDDRLRAAFIPAALAGLQRAMAEGVPVRGYVHWSLVDNFEWIFGYRIRYGLCSLNRETFARSPKPSAAVLAEIARRNGL